MFYDHTIIVLYYVFMFNVLRRCLYVAHIVQLHMLFVFRITQIILFSVLYINFVDSIYSNLNKKHVSLIIIRLLYSTYFMAYIITRLLWINSCISAICYCAVTSPNVSGRRVGGLRCWLGYRARMHEAVLRPLVRD